MKVDIGIIGAMDEEIALLVSSMTDEREEIISGMTFYLGRLGTKRVSVVKCGIGKVFAAIACQTMILEYSPKLIINTGVGGAIADGLSTGDVVIAERLVQHDMDTSPLGDPVGLVSGINKIYFDTDRRANGKALIIAEKLGKKAVLGTVASGDRFIASSEEKERISKLFSAKACEMEGAAIAQVCYVNNTPCAVIRAISDSADGEATMDYPTFVKASAKISARLTSLLVSES